MWLLLVAPCVQYVHTALTRWMVMPIAPHAAPGNISPRWGRGSAYFVRLVSIVSSTKTVKDQ